MVLKHTSPQLVSNSDFSVRTKPSTSTKNAASTHERKTMDLPPISEEEAQALIDGLEPLPSSRKEALSVIRINQKKMFAEMQATGPLPESRMSASKISAPKEESLIELTALPHDLTQKIRLSSLTALQEPATSHETIPGEQQQPERTEQIRYTEIITDLITLQSAQKNTKDLVAQLESKINLITKDLSSKNEAAIKLSYSRINSTNENLKSLEEVLKNINLVLRRLENNEIFEAYNQIYIRDEDPNTLEPLADLRKRAQGISKAVALKVQAFGDEIETQFLTLQKQQSYSETREQLNHLEESHNLSLPQELKDYVLNGPTKALYTINRIIVEAPEMIGELTSGSLDSFNQPELSSAQGHLLQLIQIITAKIESSKVVVAYQELIERLMIHCQINDLNENSNVADLTTFIRIALTSSKEEYSLLKASTTKKSAKVSPPPPPISTAQPELAVVETVTTTESPDTDTSVDPPEEPIIAEPNVIETDQPESTVESDQDEEINTSSSLSIIRQAWEKLPQTLKMALIAVFAGTFFKVADFVAAPAKPKNAISKQTDKQSKPQPTLKFKMSVSKPQTPQKKVAAIQPRITPQETQKPNETKIAAGDFIDGIHQLLLHLPNNISDSSNNRLHDLVKHKGARINLKGEGAVKHIETIYTALYELAVKSKQVDAKTLQVVQRDWKKAQQEITRDWHKLYFIDHETGKIKERTGANFNDSRNTYLALDKLLKTANQNADGSKIKGSSYEGRNLIRIAEGNSTFVFFPTQAQLYGQASTTSQVQPVQTLFHPIFKLAKELQPKTSPSQQSAPQQIDQDNNSNDSLTFAEPEFLSKASLQAKAVANNFNLDTNNQFYVEPNPDNQDNIPPWGTLTLAETIEREEYADFQNFLQTSRISFNTQAMVAEGGRKKALENALHAQATNDAQKEAITEVITSLRISDIDSNDQGNLTEVIITDKLAVVELSVIFGDLSAIKKGYS